MPAPPALDRLCAAFDLTAFERDVLVLAAGAEIDPLFPAECAAAQRNPQLAFPTFDLAVAALADPHWSALTPARPLRHWRLIEIAAGDGLMASRLRIDERVLHYVAGAPYADDRLDGIVERVPVPARLPSSYAPSAERIATLWSANGETAPVIHVCGEVRGDRRLVAAAACAAIGLGLAVVRAADIPTNAAERELFIRLWQRQAILTRCALLVDCDEIEPSALRIAQAFLDRVGGLLLVSGGVSAASSSAVRVDVPAPPARDQRAQWEQALGARAGELNGQLDAVISQFRFDAEGIRAVAQEISEDVGADALGGALWDACRGRARTSLDSLADRIVTRASWDDLVLPDEPAQLLRELVAHVRQRMTVYETWGFAAQSGRGLGISALFAGPSGTGKTLAAEVLARELRLDLYRIDLSQVVSKYIGETEKSLRRVFDAAEHSGAVLLFDEADALFGKRGEVHDSHDRYANIEVSYLLQRMEAYRGLAILTTNRRSSLDGAFLRRLRFVVSFPFPDVAQRARIWARMFPPATPTENLDVHKLARLNVSGGNIRTIAMNAAFLAADAGEPVRMTHLLRTGRAECAKLERSIAAAEIGGWV